MEDEQFLSLFDNYSIILTSGKKEFGIKKRKDNNILAFDDMIFSYDYQNQTLYVAMENAYTTNLDNMSQLFFKYFNINTMQKAKKCVFMYDFNRYNIITFYEFDLNLK